MTQPVNTIDLDLSFGPDGRGALTVCWEANEIGTRDSNFVPPYLGDDLDLVLRALDSLQAPDSFAASEIDRLAALGLPVSGGLLSARPTALWAGRCSAPSLPTRAALQP